MTIMLRPTGECNVNLCLVSLIIISSHCSSDQQSTLVNEMASAAGFASQIDPLLLQTLQSLPKSDFEEEYLVSCLLMVFVAVSVPKLARSESSFYRVSRNGSVVWVDVSFSHFATTTVRHNSTATRIISTPWRYR